MTVAVVEVIGRKDDLPVVGLTLPISSSRLWYSTGLRRIYYDVTKKNHRPNVDGRGEAESA